MVSRLPRSTPFIRSLVTGFGAPCLLVLWAAPLHGAEPWLHVHGSPRCDGSPAALAERIDEQIAGTRNPELAVEVRVRDRGHDTVGEMRVLRGTEVLASKTLVTPTCDETLEAVASVIALALSAEASAEHEPEPIEHASAADTRPERRSAIPPAPAMAVDRGMTEAPASSESRRWEAHLTTGVDVGTLSEPTALAGAGLSASFGASELRGSLWYGLPSAEEEVSASVVAASRREFAAARVELCRALDSARWLSLCAGSEARLTRLARSTEDSSHRERAERLAPGVGAGAGARFVYRSAMLQPELAITAEVPLAGTPSLAERPIVRALVGAVLPL